MPPDTPRISDATPEELRAHAARAQLESLRLRSKHSPRARARADELERFAEGLRHLARDRIAARTTEPIPTPTPHDVGDDLLTLSEAARTLRMRRGDAVRFIRRAGIVLEIDGRERIRRRDLRAALDRELPPRPKPGRRRRGGSPQDPWLRFLPE